MGKPGVAREAAVRLLDQVLQEGRTLFDALAELSALAPADRARAQRLATTVLRHLDRCDTLLSERLRKWPPLPVMNVLRLAVVELCVDRAARHGVVDGAVTLARQRGRSGKFSGFVNAVLRALADTAPEKWRALPPSRISAGLRARLVTVYGANAVAAMERGQARIPPVDLTLKPDISADGLKSRALANGSLRLTDPGRISALPGYETGDWWVQDAAAAFPVMLLDPRPGETALDLCAAPGGKTLQLAAAGAAVTAVDISAGRLTRLNENLARTGLSAQTVVCDALQFNGPLFDLILLDTPCSATGTLRRHPDLSHAKTLKKLDSLIHLQSRMLDRALTFLKPDGRLVFCTCSLLPEEGEEQIEAALKRHPGLRVDDATAPGLDPSWRDSQGGYRLRPDYWSEIGGLDGFYIARVSFVR
ncbi:MAG: RsmB/NOP family class I SAM-dependent RNA methyltransferase [Pseudomonadota bacterium]